MKKKLIFLLAKLFGHKYIAKDFYEDTTTSITMYYWRGNLYVTDEKTITIKEK